ncbi:hypothetical protein MSAN_00980900 [Mycena sanguinolenta]|uniref:Uncharacterized protein n=1 Tax=Mycena sanguinolenta TaxID=230812 RepID=A0A8H6YZM9_9AGAR|nr:hypothetical protein MSAN_00980900 [Mycena sanguinolenta]
METHLAHARRHPSIHHIMETHYETCICGMRFGVESRKLRLAGEVEFACVCDNTVYAGGVGCHERRNILRMVMLASLQRTPTPTSTKRERSLRSRLGRASRGATTYTTTQDIQQTGGYNDEELEQPHSR